MTPVGPLVVATRISVVLVVALTLQIGVAPELALFGVQADLPLLVAVAAGIAAGPERGAAVAFVSGMGYDLLLTTPLGLSALTYSLVAFVVGSVQDSVLRAAWWIPLATATVGSVVGVILYVVLGTVLGMEFLGVSVPKVSLLVGLLNAVVAPPTIRAVRWATGTTDSVRHRAVFR